jgi:hypothetical protein
LIQEKESIDAAIREEERDGGSEPAPATSTAAKDEGIAVDAISMLTAFEVNEKSATALYENRKVAVTGVLSGAFIPPVSVSMNMAAKGLAADAFVTMAGPPPSSVEDTLFVPGIKAYSENASLFGQANAPTVGDTVTLVCTFGDALRVSDVTGASGNGNANYSVMLKDCVLQTPTKAASEPNGYANPGAIPQAGDKNDPVDAYQPCVEATQHLQVPGKIDLDGPHDFSSTEGPRPQFTFLFSENGIDVYAVRTNKFGPAGYDRLALLVFQDEKVRREVLRSYITSGVVTWAYSDTGGQDWKPIVNFKYETLDFGWFHRSTGLEPSVSTAIFYAPPACDSVSEPSGARPSSMIGIYISASPSDLPHDSLRYRAAQALWKFQMQEGSK